MPRSILSLVALIFPAFVSPFALGEPSLIQLGVLPGTRDSSAFAMSSGGAVVVGISGLAGFRWSPAQGISALETPPGQWSFAAATDVSADGLVAVGMASVLDRWQACRWTGTQLSYLEPVPTSEHSWATSASEDGTIVVGYRLYFDGNTWVEDAFHWTVSGGMVGLGTVPGGTSSQAFGVSADGTVVVGTAGLPDFMTVAFRWTSLAGMEPLGVLPGTDSTEARSISADGEVVVGVATRVNVSRMGFRWTRAAGMQSLGVPAGGLPYSEARAISGDGSTIVGDYRLPGGWVSFIYSEANGMQDVSSYLTGQGVDLTDWLELSANALNFDGSTIAGRGFYRGEPRAWIVANLGPPASPACASDANRDGEVGFADITAVLMNWGILCP